MANDLLREHLTRVGFDLSLGKTHVEALVFLDVALQTREYQRSPSMFVHASHGLQARGLVEHTARSREFLERRRQAGRSGDLTGIYKITRAGRIVISLLKEAGLYQDEHVRLFPPLVLVEETA